MTHIKPLRYTAVITAILCGTTAHADVTAQQVWDNWKGQAEIYGQGFTTGAETMDGDTLTVEGVNIEMSDDEAAVNAAIGTIVLTENGDGSVNVTMAESYPITINITPPAGDPSTINMTVQQTGMTLVVSGDPEAMLYNVAAERYAMSIDTLEGEAAEAIDLQEAMFAMMDLSGTYSVSTDTLTRIIYDLSVGAVDIDVSLTENGGPGTVQANGDIADLTAFARVVAPLDMDMDADEPPFKDGLALEGGYTFGNMVYSFDIDADGEAASGAASVEGGEMNVAFDIDRMVYTGESRGITVNVLVPEEIPFPLEASLGKYGFDFQIPLSQGEDGPRDARMAFNVTDLAVSDTLWNIADPRSILPRDPITISIGIDAQVTPFFDLLDPEQQEALAMSDVPGELNGLQITDLTVRGAGAEITGGGAFTFDNTDLESFDGLPRPEGQVNFAINGVNGLVDKLVQMGLIPEDEAMMPRMMLGMFATPVGDDMLTSTIEVNSEGHVLANGQRLR